MPGTGFIRDRYSPDNSADYNSALKRTDEAAAALGIGMMKAGTGTMAAGGVLATAGVGVTASTAATGGVMVMNSSKNKSDGYKRGKSSKNSSSDYTFIQGTPGNKRKVTTQIPNGYKKVKGHYPHGADVFYNGKRYISPDKDNHNGGMWKMAKKPEDLFNKNKRMGTYDENLIRIGD